MILNYDFVRDLLEDLESADSSEFLQHVSNSVEWTVFGRHPLAGCYRSRADLDQHVLRRLMSDRRQPFRLRSFLIDVDWVVAELSMLGGGDFNRPSSLSECCFIIRLYDSQIVEGRSYLDGVAVQDLIAWQAEQESGLG